MFAKSIKIGKLVAMTGCLLVMAAPLVTAQAAFADDDPYQGVDVSSTSDQGDSGSGTDISGDSGSGIDIGNLSSSDDGSASASGWSAYLPSTSTVDRLHQIWDKSNSVKDFVTSALGAYEGTGSPLSATANAYDVVNNDPDTATYLKATQAAMEAATGHPEQGMDSIGAAIHNFMDSLAPNQSASGSGDAISAP